MQTVLRHHPCLSCYWNRSSGQRRGGGRRTRRHTVSTTSVHLCHDALKHSPMVEAAPGLLQANLLRLRRHDRRVPGAMAGGRGAGRGLGPPAGWGSAVRAHRWAPCASLDPPNAATRHQVEVVYPSVLHREIVSPNLGQSARQSEQPPQQGREWPLVADSHLEGVGSRTLIGLAKAWVESGHRQQSNTAKRMSMLCSFHTLHDKVVSWYTLPDDDFWGGDG